MGLRNLRLTGVSSSVNTTTTPLSSGATFTGTWEQNDYNEVMVSCQTDNSGTLFLEYSVDGVTAVTEPIMGYTIQAGIHVLRIAVKGPRYFRVRLVNDSGAQSYLNLYTYFGTFGNPREPFEIKEQYGHVDNIAFSNSPVDLWSFGSETSQVGAQKTFPTVAGDFYICSNSTSDVNVDVLLEYINTSGHVYTITPNLNGQTPVDVGVDGFDILRATVDGTVNALGDIYINTESNHSGGIPSDSSTVLAYIEVGYGASEMASYTVPTGKKIVIKKVQGTIVRSSGGNGSGVLQLRVREYGKVWVVKRNFHLSTMTPLDYDVGEIEIPARANVILTIASVSDADSLCHGSFKFEEYNE